MKTLTRVFWKGTPNGEREALQEIVTDCKPLKIKQSSMTLTTGVILRLMFASAHSTATAPMALRENR